jgi:hypothetical protein
MCQLEPTRSKINKEMFILISDLSSLTQNILIAQYLLAIIKQSSQFVLNINQSIPYEATIYLIKYCI